MKINNKLQNNDKSNNSRNTLGIGVGATIGLSPLPILLRDKITALSNKTLHEKQARLMNKAKEMGSFENIIKDADDIVFKTGLKSNGVKIRKETSSTILYAHFNPKSNTILINDKSFYVSVFKEIGHALNFHNGNSTKFLIKMKKVCSKIVPIIGISGLFIKLLHNKKTSKNKTKFEQTKNFISDNAGPILFLTYVPILLEEGIASKKALKLAKPYLTKLQHLKHMKNLSLALSSCLSIPIMFATATNLGVFAKNKITNNTSL